MGCLVSGKGGNQRTGSARRNLDFRGTELKAAVEAHPTKPNRTKLKKKVQLQKT